MKIIVGMSGASGIILGVELVKTLGKSGCETHLVITHNARKTLELETGLSIENLGSLVHQIHANDDLSAPIASGSFRTDGMVVIPCSMKSAAGIVSGYSDSLLLRAADVCIKEQRKLVIVPRETPLSVIHLRNLYQAARAGCVVIPMMMTFYNQPQTPQDMINYLLGKVMAQFGLDFTAYPEWQGGGNATPNTGG